MSDWLVVLSGIPRGSVLGAWLFLIFINDLYYEINNWILKFANDTKIFGSIITEKVIVGLQKDLNRRWRDDLIETYKIITGKENINSNQFFTPYTGIYDTRGHCRKLETTRSRLKLRKKKFSQRVVRHWNKLSDNVVNASTVNTFKNSLDREWGNNSSY